ncbi:MULTISPECIES: biotin/lipoyl-containing protein [Cellulophaga]|uniref:Biotin/lipoyl attachment domain-containing protein n=2 Tax=Cellulophaga TaxID=104264 RepID=F0RHH0_CELLC|nr:MULTISPECIES: biotin/lipoyl-containing protein [Cellulophaga]ADY30236.1 biotin/lipoyl attachment domain-containing protein [Cellulophaga lytica DSM 7489]AIM61228.1 acetyl-COA carboxylase [Cellulophaga lytica]APU11116.1 acetyl-CoA carboxylase biotin carboxyl carrier protein subunit [Cellulophaga lytica]EWH11631.1 biotin/lipoyl attachment domain-containing protein [Cellulophaga geojensis KL-A]MDO6855120.1 biotin/lipoyl-containing protein [Cellulophaga lytica]
MKTYVVSVNDEEITVNSKEVSKLNIVKDSDEEYHILEDNKKYNAKLISANFLEKTLKVEVNGNSYTIAIADEYDQMVKKMGLLAVNTKKEKNINAPMPGLILDILVTEGQEVKEGEQVLVLSAMKMENIITAPSDGVVSVVNVAKDDAVEKGQLLIEIA